MNERIKQIANKAGAIHIHEKPSDRALVGYDNIDKFAELIIEEALSELDHHEFATDTEFERGFVEGFGVARNIIAAHFEAKR